MNIKEIAQKLTEWFNANEMMKPYQELYSPNIVSVEQDGEFARCDGMDAVMKKGEWWTETFEVHSASASEPLVADDWFSVMFTMDTTHKPSGQRSTMSEIGVYQVKDGKIVYEEFFYNTDK